LRLIGLGKLEKMTLSEIEPAMFRLGAYCLNKVRYRVPRMKHIASVISQMTALFIISADITSDRMRYRSYEIN
jgi:hypothetical protein